MTFFVHSCASKIRNQSINECMKRKTVLFPKLDHNRNIVFRIKVGTASCFVLFIF